MRNDVKLYLALPVLKEFVNLPTLMESLYQQTERNFHLVACVNHYEHWRKQAEYEETVSDNEKSLAFLWSVNEFPVTVIDHASLGKGWSPKKGGVGWARKVAMDFIEQQGNTHDIIVSIDADTYYPPNYLAVIKETFLENRQAVGLAVPYYHQLAGDDTDRLILHYELYMRHYALNMLRIQNPYAYTAVGSAMAFPVWSYRKAGGITPVKSGEDFYFMQKLVKTGKLINWCESVAYPSPRFSSRVVFGTGPALIKGSSGDWSSYPIYAPELFDRVAATYQCFTRLYLGEVPTPMDAFLFSCFKTRELWAPLRKNYRSAENFIQACTNKVDGLRILQFLRQGQASHKTTDARVLASSYPVLFKSVLNDKQLEKLISDGLEILSIEELSLIRDGLFSQENTIKREMYFNSL